MSTDATRRVIEGYLGDLGGHWLAHDIAVVDVTTGVRATGRAAAFALARTVLREMGAADVLAVDTRAAVEWTEPVATAALFEVQQGEIVQLHLYRSAVEATT